MRRICAILTAALISATAASSQPWTPSEWPSLKHYDGNHLYRIALPLGGIGTGTVSLGGRGELRDWEIMNSPGKGFNTTTTGNNAPFFAIYVKGPDAGSQTRLLSGPLYPYEYFSGDGKPANHAGLPRFAEASFDAAYPFGQVALSDPSLPVKVRVKGFNPLIPGDSDSSGLPIAVLSYEVTNLTDSPVEVSVCGAIRNFVGKDPQRYTLDWKGDRSPSGNVHNFNEYRETDSLKGIHFRGDGLAEDDSAAGNFALSTDCGPLVTYRTYTTDDRWSNAMLNFWDDFSDDGLISNPEPGAISGIGGDKDPMGALAVKGKLAGGETRCFNFYLTWNFPNRYAWSESVVGNYYSTLWPDSWESACKIVPQIPALEQRTLNFVNALLDSSYPDVVKEASLFNLSVLRSQTVFRIRDGHMMGWEGVMDRCGSCKGSCTHVWNYEVATPFLFGDLARTMRDVEFAWALLPDGQMDFRKDLPLESTPKKGRCAADGQMGCIMKLYREWQLSGERSFLERYWPACKSALAFAWTEGGWDADKDGVMEGSQHNTMDVNYFGPNPQMGFWYLGALRAAEEMALEMKDKAFARECRELFERGRVWMDENLFNGEYYEQMFPDPDSIPPYQLGKGCLVDQLVGQYMSHICGLGYLADKGNIVTTNKSVMKYNYVEDFGAVFNNMRSYVLSGESGLIMASWPKGRLEVPFPYFPEAMTGFEYCAAVEMMYEGLESDALKCMKAVRERFDGSRRNPFDEPEWGHNYARSMASWASILAWSGFHYSGVEGSMSFTSRCGKYFWSNSGSWGTCEITPSEVTLTLIEGSLNLNTLSLEGRTRPVAKAIKLSQGDSITVRL